MDELILEILPLGLFQTNCYIVGCPQTRTAMVLDPGGEVAPVLERTRALGVKVALVVNTHGHYDHIVGNAELVRATGAPLAIHELDAPLLYAPQYDFSVLLGLRRERSQPDRLLRDGDTVEVGTLTFKVLHTPGHTPGCICLLGHGVLFSGDTLFHLGVGRTDLPGGDMETLIHSLEEVVLPLDEKLVVYPGHGPQTTIGYEKRYNPFL
jgi:glyoxylase-like metal-dependent hydrolase (beta-lactamase superfamily II)